jgi:N-methylhydantoinase A
VSFRIGADIGGTFTDFTIVDETGNLTLWKQDSTPDDPVRGILEGLENVSREMGMASAELLAATELFVHGSTIATNTVIQRNGARVGLLCTEGHRDSIYWRDGYKWDRFNAHLARPRDFVDRYLRIGIPERLNYVGDVITELDEAAVRSAAELFREQGVEAVGVTFLWSVVNNDHEQRAAAIVKEVMRDVPVICGSDVLPEIREWERTSATVLGAYVSPKISNYLERLEQRLAEMGLPRRPLIMQINGGCASVAEIVRRPVNALASGPAAAPAAALHYTDVIASQNVITMDMGGTSLDVALIRDGRPAMSRVIEVEHQPVGVAGVEVVSIGAGGGSIGWVDDGGALRVGPRSAGANPGPACYGAGGTEPTVTDANLVLGYLSPDAFLGGRRRLREDLSIEAMRTRLAEPLGLTPQEAAAGMLELVDSNMVGAIRAMSVERGIDPRPFTLMSGGGAGGLHAARLARAIGMQRVSIPREASTFCSFGMTVTEVRNDTTRSLHRITNETEPAEIQALYDEMEQAARERLRQDGFSEESIRLERFVDARYPNQIHELTIPISAAAPLREQDLRILEQTFHDQHHAHFTYSMPELPVEILHWRLSAFGRLDVVQPTTPADTVSDGETLSGSALVEEREVFLVREREQCTAPVYDAEALVRGAVVTGPAIVQSPITTILVGVGDVLTSDGDGGFIVDIGVIEEGELAGLKVSSSAQ